MKCSGCAAKIIRALQELPGVTAAEVSLETGLATVVSDGNRELLLKVRATINGLGYGIDDLKMYPNTGCRCGLPSVEG